ncbi:unnamed protein product, partial [Staurois parvus]
MLQKGSRNDVYCPPPHSITTGSAHPISVSPGPTTPQLLHKHRDSPQASDSFPGTCSNTFKHKPFKLHEKHKRPGVESPQHFTPSGHPSRLCSTSKWTLLPQEPAGDLCTTTAQDSISAQKSQLHIISCNGNSRVREESSIRKKHKKKKRKASESSEIMERTEKVISHLDPERQKLKLEKTKIKPKKAKSLQGHTSPKPVPEPTNNVESSQETMRKKKKRRKEERPVDYSDRESAASVKSTNIVSLQDAQGDHEIMKIKKKKKHKLHKHDSQESEESESAKGQKHKAQEINCDSVFYGAAPIQKWIQKGFPPISRFQKKKPGWPGVAPGKIGVLFKATEEAGKKAHGPQGEIL